jgi:large subunit ribosomal protein L21
MVSDILVCRPPFGGQVFSRRAMYAVIRAGGKQHKVAKGDVIEIERLKEGSETIEFVPLLIVDDKGKTRSAKKELSDARVMATVVGESKGPKIEVMKYRNKTGYRRHQGHRQKYTTVQISDIKLTAGRGKKAPEGEATTDGA